MLNQRKAGVLLSYLQIIIGTLVGLLYTPIMLRLLGQSSYGLYTLVLSVISYLSLLTCGFSGSYLRFYSRYKAQRNQTSIARLNGLFLIVFTVLGLIGLICGIILANNVGVIFKTGLTTEETQTARILMLILTVNIVLSFPASVFSSYVTAQEDFIFLRLVTVIQTVISPLVTLPVLLMGYGTIGMVVVTVVLSIIMNGIIVWKCLSQLGMKFYFRNPDLDLLKEITVFSSYIAINIIVDQVNWSVDKILLGRFWNTQVVAVYGVASQLNSMFLQISTAISNVFIPQVNLMVAQRKSNTALSELFIKIGRIQYLLMGLLVSGFIFFGQRFILLWAGNEYSQAYPITLLLVVPLLIPLIQNIGIEIQRAKNMERFRAFLYLFMALFNFLISWQLCPKYGGIGCAFGTALSLIIANGLIINIYYYKKVGLNILGFWKQIIKMSIGMILPIFLGIILIQYINVVSTALYILFIFLYLDIYLWSVWRFSMNSYEKELMLSILKKIKYMILRIKVENK